MGRYGVFGSACDPITIGHLVTMEIDHRSTKSRRNDFSTFF